MIKEQQRQEFINNINIQIEQKPNYLDESNNIKTRFMIIAEFSPDIFQDLESDQYTDAEALDDLTMAIKEKIRETLADERGFPIELI